MVRRRERALFANLGLSLPLLLGLAALVCGILELGTNLGLRVLLADSGRIG